MHNTFRIVENKRWIARGLSLLNSVGTWRIVSALVGEGCDQQFAIQLRDLLDPEGPGT